MATVWVVVADEAIARILQLRAPRDPLEEAETLTDAAAHAKEGDLRRDAARLAEAQRGQALDGHVAARVEREFDLDLTHDDPRALKERLFAG